MTSTTISEPDLSLTTESLGDLAQYAKSEGFKPDKATKWSIEDGDDGWSLSHLSIRGEIELLLQSLQALATHSINERSMMDDWKVESLEAMWKHHRSHIVSHQTVEDEILQPALEERFRYPDKAAAGHAELEGLLTKIDQALQSVVRDKTRTSVQNLLTISFNDYRKAMLEHLHAEEALGVPLLRAYFTQAEFKPIGRTMGKTGGPPGSFVYFMGEDKFRNDFMKRAGMPSFVWHMVFAPAVQEFRNDFLRHATALTETNEPPPPPEATSYSCTVM